ncbi:transposase [Fuchsiella alkaliacetigena]|uniref:transposase n=1 Tax=Fuchsiella alkaliacetigena TaxID=957042 RepID=UPI00200A3A61|nr:transposase [Fuchsiella alkaliacetigena]MCK8826127.1 transposase [Fuchsiella alkaliacetigena]
MPDDSISNEFTLDNCLENMNLPLTNPQYNHIHNLTSSIINTEGEKNLSNLENATFDSPDQSCMSRFLMSDSWLSDFTNETRVEEAINFACKKAKDDETGFLIIDDTLLPQSENNTQMEGTGFHKAPSSADKKYCYSHCITSSHLSIGKVSMPLDFELYLKEDYCQENNKEFNTKIELGQSLIKQFDKYYNFNQNIYVMTDSWYNAESLINCSLDKGYDYIGATPINYTIDHNDESIKISGFYTKIEVDELEFVYVDDEFYYVYEYEGRVANIDNAKLLLCWENGSSLEDAPKCILTTDLSLDKETIIKYYSKRWEIETSYFYFKNELGLADYRLHSLKSIIRYLQLVYLAYNYLEILKVLSPDDERLSYFIDLASDYFFKDLVDYIHEAGKKGIPIEQVYDTLDLDGNKLQLVA